MATATYISSSCVISHQAAYKNGQPVFEKTGTDLPGFFTALYQHLGAEYPKFYKMDQLSKLGWLAAELLIDKTSMANYPADEVGVILSNSNSSLDVDIRYMESVKTIASPALFVYTLPNIMIGEICIRHRIKGENAFFISPQFDAAFMAEYVNNLINNNILQAGICGWVELTGNEYKAVLMLVEKKKGDQPDTLFTVENINKIYQTDNG